MAEVVGQGDGLDQVLVQAQGAADGAGDLGDLERVGKPSSVVVAVWVDEDLGFVLEAAEACGVEDAVAVALVTGAHRVLGFWVGSTDRGNRERSEGGELVLLAPLGFFSDVVRHKEQTQRLPAPPQVTMGVPVRLTNSPSHRGWGYTLRVGFDLARRAVAGGSVPSLRTTC